MFTQSLYTTAQESNGVSYYNLRWNDVTLAKKQSIYKQVSNSVLARATCWSPLITELCENKFQRITLNRMSSCVRPPGGMSATGSGMTWHFDYRAKPGCITVVYVMYSDGGGSLVHGGAVNYSNRPQGTISRRPEPRANSYATMHVRSNCLYILPASHVEHAVTALVHDRNSEVVTRYALVLHMKFKSDACRQLAKIAWAQTCRGGGGVGTTTLYCEQCLTSDEELVYCFDSQKAAQAHNRRQHQDIVGSAQSVVGATTTRGAATKRRGATRMPRRQEARLYNLSAAGEAEQESGLRRSKRIRASMVALS
jgi:hypothetical protein